MTKKKPVLLWRTENGLGGRAPDDFQTMPNAVAERLIETLMNEGRIVIVLTWNPEVESVAVERHILKDDKGTELLIEKENTDFLFDDERAMVRLDMSEYMEKHTVSRLIGAPPGYVGYEEGGQLTEAIKRRPYSIILLDEIEKAHADVFNILLQILDDGRLTDGKGRTVSFKNTIIIMTSNLGSQIIKELSQDFEKMENEAGAILESHFRPEFLNRVDEIVIFRALSREVILEIVDLQIDELRKRLEEKKIDIEISEEAKKLLAERGYDPVYGARPLKRTIQRDIQNPLALKILEGEYGEGDKLKIDVDSKKNFLFKK